MIYTYTWGAVNSANYPGGVAVDGIIRCNPYLAACGRLTLELEVMTEHDCHTTCSERMTLAYITGLVNNETTGDHMTYAVAIAVV